METTLFAQPYAYGAVGFYFNSLEDYEAKYKANYENNHIEEYEIQFIDGSDIQTKLFSISQISQCSLEAWFDDLENIADDDDKAIQIMYLLEIGYKLDDAIERFDEVCLFRGSAEDYAAELYEECYDIPEHLFHYIDYEKIARDLEIEGNITEFSYNIFITNSNEF